MAIPIKREPKDMHDNTGIYERCYFCRNHTATWHENTNNPVCFPCSKEHKVGELPDHGKNIRARKRKKRLEEKEK